jgi:Stress responsive A/B Barrel Domain
MRLLNLFLFLQLFTAASGIKPVKHVVMFSFNEAASKAQRKQIQTELLELPKKIPEIQDYELGVDLLLQGGQNHPAGKNRVVCWSATFKSKKDYETYDSSEAHKEFLALLKPLVQPGSRAAIQYEISDAKTR